MTSQQDVTATPPRAVVYMRFATADTAGHKAGAARRVCEHRANELGAAIVAEYSDISSGLTDQGKQLKWMMADLNHATDISYVIVPEHSMLARNAFIYARIVRKIEQTGARLIVASEPTEDYQQQTPPFADREVSASTGASTGKEVRP